MVSWHLSNNTYHAVHDVSSIMSSLFALLLGIFACLSASVGSAAPHGAFGAGVQIATKQIDEGIAAGLMAAQAGATWLDLNCGCPIYGTPTHTHTFLCMLSPMCA